MREGAGFRQIVEAMRNARVSATPGSFPGGAKVRKRGA